MFELPPPEVFKNENPFIGMLLQKSQPVVTCMANGSPLVMRSLPLSSRNISFQYWIAKYLVSTDLRFVYRSSLDGVRATPLTFFEVLSFKIRNVWILDS